MTNEERAERMAWVDEQLKEISSWRTLSKPLNGQVFIAPMVEKEKPTIIRPDQRTEDVVAEERRAIVVATSDGMWSREADQYIPLDLEVGDGVQLVQAEGIYAGAMPVEDPLCPVRLLTIHYRSLVGKFNLRQWLMAQVGLEPEEPKKFLNGEG